MARRGPAGKNRSVGEGRSSKTRSALVAAAIRALVEDGFVGASARNIAERAGVNQGLVFYHFGSVTELLLAALDEVSSIRMEAYGAAVATASAPSELVEVASRIFRNDLDSGYVKVLVEMIAGSGTSSELRAAVAARIAPWFEFTNNAIAGAMASSPFATLLPADDVAFAVVALYLGLELLTHLDGDVAPADRLFSHALLLTRGLAPIATSDQEPTL